MHLSNIMWNGTKVSFVAVNTHHVCLHGKRGHWRLGFELFNLSGKFQIINSDGPREEARLFLQHEEWRQGEQLHRKNIQHFVFLEGGIHNWTSKYFGWCPYLLCLRSHQLQDMGTKDLKKLDYSTMKLPAEDEHFGALRIYFAIAIIMFYQPELQNKHEVFWKLFNKKWLNSFCYPLMINSV